MTTTVWLQQLLTDYLNKFINLAEQYDGTIRNSSELEQVVDDYSAFITNKRNQDAWEQLERQSLSETLQLAAELRKTSARCVAVMEKYRALKLLSGETDRTDYFRNIESCIEQEFGSFQVSPDSKVFMVGSGSFPMTPLLIAKRTNAEVMGIDIDSEAIELGRRVANMLGSGLRIRLENASIEHLDWVKDATHIVFSSTVSNKYVLLDRLHSLTQEQVVVAMRYGNRLKSLFNFPMQDVDGRKWRLVDTILRPDHVFDIALYQKA
ncbi:class I SAM-dependent methyltransferase [Paenibacillus sp. RC67]|uniref:class I SAM-dependent methyltransferase n=1 Tax=Paenibacillus sp. RC67 TaxID=3039392 RepID=UPI0024ADFCEC|nr:class I SAM-dependent methyltransferase [Paenibacillus sp. RC67]